VATRVLLDVEVDVFVDSGQEIGAQHLCIRRKFYEKCRHSGR